MKAVVTKENFKRILNLVSHIAGHTITLPILSNILIETEKGRMKISATNLEVGLTAWLGGRVEQDGSITLPAKTITDYVSSTNGDQITLEVIGTNLNVSTENSSASIKTLPAEEFPLIPQINASSTVRLPAGELRQILAEVIFAAAPIETQPELAGVYTYIKDGSLYCVATDRYRLIERSIHLAEAVEGEFKAIIIPFKTVQEVIRLTSTVPDDTIVNFIQGENQILFQTADIELVSRVIDGQFPDYNHLIPTEFTGQATLPRQQLAQALKSTSLFTSSGRSVKLHFKPEDGSVEVFAASGDLGESQVKVLGEFTGQDYEGIFNFRFLLDYLNNISDEKIIFKVINENSPAVLIPANRTDNLYLVMPVRA
jgi:DNA polymerase-3 subunit beta